MSKFRSTSKKAQAVFCGRRETRSLAPPWKVSTIQFTPKLPWFLIFFNHLLWWKMGSIPPKKCGTPLKNEGKPAPEKRVVWIITLKFAEFLDHLRLSLHTLIWWNYIPQTLYPCCLGVVKKTFPLFSPEAWIPRWHSEDSLYRWTTRNSLCIRQAESQRWWR